MEEVRQMMHAPIWGSDIGACTRSKWWAVGVCTNYSSKNLKIPEVSIMGDVAVCPTKQKSSPDQEAKFGYF